MNLPPPLPPWALPHQSILQAVDLAGLSPVEQVALLAQRGLPPERARRLVLALPPPTSQGQRERVRRAAIFMNQDPVQFWPMVEALQVYWGIHPWSVLGESLRGDLARSWGRELGCVWHGNGLRFVGVLGGERPLPPGLCVSRLLVDRFTNLRRLPPRLIVDRLELRHCPQLRGSLAEVSVLESWAVEGCPRFSTGEDA